MRKSLALIRLLRPGQWVKNLFLFIPIFFSGELADELKLKHTVLAFLSFCFTASAIYVINDLKDIDSDRQHPTKNKRPLASGEVTIPQALILFGLSLISGLLLAYSTSNYYFCFIILFYFFLNLAYSFGLKKISILDILIVATGFVLRTIAGGLVAGVQVSQWMVVMIFLLALFLAIAKRRDDLIVFEQSGKIMRKSIEHYNLDYINAVLMMISAVIIVAYLMYVISPEVISRFHSQHLYLTSIFVIAGIMRYLQITLVENKSGSPTKILYTDNFIRFIVAGWVAVFYLIIYHL